MLFYISLALDPENLNFQISKVVILKCCVNLKPSPIDTDISREKQVARRCFQEVFLYIINFLFYSHARPMKIATTILSLVEQGFLHATTIQKISAISEKKHAAHMTAIFPTNQSEIKNYFLVVNHARIRGCPPFQRCRKFSNKGTSLNKGRKGNRK